MVTPDSSFPPKHRTGWRGSMVFLASVLATNYLSLGGQHTRDALPSGVAMDAWIGGRFPGCSSRLTKEEWR